MSDYIRQLQANHIARQHRLNPQRPLPRSRPQRLKFIDPEIIFIQQMTKLVCEEYNYSRHTIMHGRNQKITSIKFIIFYHCYFGRSIPANKIAKSCGQHCGSNVVYGAKRIKAKIQTDELLAKRIKFIGRQLGV